MDKDTIIDQQRQEIERLRAAIAARDALLKEARDFIIRHGQGDFYTINGIVESIDAQLKGGGDDK